VDNESQNENKKNRKISTRDWIFDVIAGLVRQFELRSLLLFIQAAFTTIHKYISKGMIINSYIRMQRAITRLSLNPLKCVASRDSAVSSLVQLQSITTKRYLSLNISTLYDISSRASWIDNKSNVNQLFYCRPCTRNTNISGSRTFSSSASPNPATTKSCWNCETLNDLNDLFCKEEGCRHILDVNSKDLDYFKLFDLELSSYNIDPKLLEGKFKNLQKLLHPDKFTTKSINEKNLSLNASSIVNQAYQILRTPMDRLNYIISKRFNINILDDSGETFKDPKLMLEMFELREEASEIESELELRTFVGEKTKTLELLGNKLDELVRKFDEIKKKEIALNEVSGEATNEVIKMQQEITHTAIRMKYISKVLQEIESKKI
jgi:molecular chaperone HscB